MSSLTTDLPSPAAARHQLGSYLREQRHQQSLHLTHVAPQVGISASSLSRIETGRAPMRTSYLTVMLDLYGIDDQEQRRHLADLARQGQRKHWWAIHETLIPAGTAHYLALENAAASIRVYAPQVIPDLLATLEYAEAAMRATRADLSAAQAAQLASLTHARRQFPARGQRLQVVLDESALHCVEVPAEVAMAQFRHMAGLIADPAVTLQVRVSGSAVISPPFTLLTMPVPAQCVGCYHGPAGQISTTRRDADTAAMNATWSAIEDSALTPEASAAMIARLVACAMLRRERAG